ncbi:ParA family protein [Acidobacteriota bacterium]
MILTIANQKGGVGKTTTAVNLAAGLSAAGHRTLLIDADPQGNSTVSYLDPCDQGPSIFQVLIDPDVPAEQAIVPSSIPKLSILPATNALFSAERRLAGDPAGPYLLKDKLAKIKKNWKFIIIDTPPNLGILTANALVAASHLIIPVQASYYALEGTEELLETVRRIKAGFNTRLTILGVLITLRDRRTILGRDISRKIREMFGDLVFDCEISRSVRVEESPAYKEPLLTFAPQCQPALDYFSLCREVLRRTKKTALSRQRRGNGRPARRGAVSAKSKPV